VEKHDLEFMREAIKWANACHPVKESIPKVGAIIAVGDEMLVAVAEVLEKQAMISMPSVVLDTNPAKQHG
jgi:pyrimidine deaminase RibD-like protein